MQAFIENQTFRKMREQTPELYVYALDSLKEERAEVERKLALLPAGNT